MAVAAIILAAGRSTRMGSENKLLADFNGEPLLCATVRAVLGSRVAQTIVVTGHQADEVRRILAGQPLKMAHNQSFADGLSTSLKAGLAALEPHTAGILVCLGDMPLVTSEQIDALLTHFEARNGQYICIPAIDGRRGNPVLWPGEFAGEMRELSGDKGARELLQRHSDRVVEVPMEDKAVLRDVDTPADLAEIKAVSKT